MENKIFVRIKSGEYVEALDPSRARRAVLHLTTIEDYQTAAEIPLFLGRGGERVPLRVLSVEGLSPLSSKECRLDLETRLVGRRSAEFRVVQNGRAVRTETLRLPAAGVGRGILTGAAILAAAAAAVLLSFLLIRGCSAGPARPPARTPSGPASSAAPAVPVVPSSPSSAAAAPASSTAEAPASAAPHVAPAAPAAASPPPPAAFPVPEQAPVRADPLAAAREAFRTLGEETVTIYFSADSAEILRDQRDKLETVAALLARYPELVVRISGHCATAGTEKGRIALSKDRARAVYAALSAAGWKPRKDPTVEGFGDERPATRAEDGQALNRRVEIRLEP